MSILYRDNSTVFAYNPTESQIHRIITANGEINYFEVKFIQETFDAYVRYTGTRIQTPYFVGGMRNYMYIIISNETPYETTTTNTYLAML